MVGFGVGGIGWILAGRLNRDVKLLRDLGKACRLRVIQACFGWWSDKGQRESKRLLHLFRAWSG